MEIRQARAMARTLLDELGVKDFALVIDARPQRRLGQCRYARLEIGLSRRFVELNEWAVVDQVVRHEAAHAFVGPGYGHGSVWKRKAREFGVRRPASTNREAVMAAGSIDIMCAKCGVVGTAVRMPKRTVGRVHVTCRYPVTFERRVPQTA